MSGNSHAPGAECHVKLSSFDFSLPERLIAQFPLPERDQSRLMVVHRATGSVEHRLFRDLPDILQPHHFLVINTTRVIPARLWARRPGKQERIEILLVREESERVWSALVRPARKVRPGQELQLGDLRAEVKAVLPDGRRRIEFAGSSDVRRSLHEIGEPPLPPYIRRQA